MHVTIPKTIEGAVEALAGVQNLLRAKEWEKAAIVFAFTHDGDRGGRPAKETVEIPTVSFRAFSDLGIAGLRTADTVARYHRAWASAVKAGHAMKAEPGDPVVLPTIPWEQNSATVNLPESTKVAVEQAAAEHDVGPQTLAVVVQNPNAIEAAMAADPKARAAAIRGLNRHSADERAKRSEHVPEEVIEQRERDALADKRAEIIGHVTEAWGHLESAKYLVVDSGDWPDGAIVKFNLRREKLVRDLDLLTEAVNGDRDIPAMLEAFEAALDADDEDQARIQAERKAARDAEFNL